MNKYEQTDYINGQLMGDYKLSANGNSKLRAGISAVKQFIAFLILIHFQELLILTKPYRTDMAEIIS